MKKLIGKKTKGCKKNKKKNERERERKREREKKKKTQGHKGTQVS